MCNLTIDEYLYRHFWKDFEQITWKIHEAFWYYKNVNLRNIPVRPLHSTRQMHENVFKFNSKDARAILTARFWYY